VTPTSNGELCQFPYELDDQQLHFCHYDENSTDYLCPTESGQQAKCVQGKLRTSSFRLDKRGCLLNIGQYGYKSTSNPAGFLAIYKSNTNIVMSSSNEQHCLGFYYYFKDPFCQSNITFLMHSNSNGTRSKTIVTVNPNSENKWSYSETTFTPITEQYNVRKRVDRLGGIF
jgi:hypothetical protein